MKTLLIFFTFTLSGLVMADQGIYLSASGNFTYGSGSGDEKSSLIGPGVSLTGGLKIRSFALEGGVKRFTLSNTQIGNDSYETEIKNSLLFGGVRVILDEIFSLKAGFVSHNIEMDIYEGNQHLTNIEDDGEYFGLYGGMGIVNKLNRKLDFFFESTLYPVSDINFYFVDIEVGLRFYL